MCKSTYNLQNYFIAVISMGKNIATLCRWIKNLSKNKHNLFYAFIGFPFQFKTKQITNKQIIL